MSITPQMIKELRDETGAGFMDCKQALEQAGGDMEKARLILREKGAIIATKRASKEVNQGVIAGKVSDDLRTGAVIDLRCETDFVARNEEFQALASELLDQVLAFGQEGSAGALAAATLAQRPDAHRREAHRAGDGQDGRAYCIAELRPRACAERGKRRGRCLYPPQQARGRDGGANWERGHSGVAIAGA
jgi:hypothetical protein